jgi:hypothetical protein
MDSIKIEYELFVSSLKKEEFNYLIKIGGLL